MLSIPTTKLFIFLIHCLSTHTHRHRFPFHMAYKIYSMKGLECVSYEISHILPQNPVLVSRKINILALIRVIIGIVVGFNNICYFVFVRNEQFSLYTIKQIVFSTMLYCIHSLCIIFYFNCHIKRLPM